MKVSILNIFLFCASIAYVATKKTRQNTMDINSSLLYSPKTGWINDPNGLVYVNGIYHLFYQYSPTANRPKNVCWGHSTSKDLVSWQDLGIAIPYQENTTEEIFSGSAVVDSTNSSGLCDANHTVVALYTSRYQTKTTLADGSEVPQWTQAQTVAHSCDNGDTWTANKIPSIRNPPEPYRDHFSEFRDPNVLWYAPHNKWVMTIVMSDLEKAIWYSSTNLLNWTLTGEFNSSKAPKGLWECPALMEFPVQRTNETKWVFVMSVNPGGRVRSSGMFYHIGHFDGYTFRADDKEGVKWFDYGADTYAGIFWSNLPTNRKIMSIYINNWEYGIKLGNIYNGGISTRELSLVKVGNVHKLFQAPIQQLDNYEKKEYKFTKLLLEMGMKMLKNESYRISIAMKGVNESDFSYIIEDEMKNLVAKIYFTRENNTVCVTRRKPDSDDKNSLENHCTELTVSYELEIVILIDNCTMTVFLKDGEYVFTEILPFSFEKRRLRLRLGFYKLLVKAKQIILSRPRP